MADVSEKARNQMTYHGIFWIYDILFGGLWGVLSMLLEFMVLEVQPTAYLARIAAIKGILVQICVGFGVVCVGLLWHLSYNWFWFVQSIWLAVSLLLLVILVVCEMKQYK